MKVCRIEKDTVFRKVGEVITASKKEHNYSEGRAKAESMLEDVRKQDYLRAFARISEITLCFTNFLKIPVDI